MRSLGNQARPAPVKVKGVHREVLNGIHDAIKSAKHANDSGDTIKVADLLVALVPVLKAANPAFDVERFAVGLTDVGTINRLVALNVIAPALKGII
jgi:hypothetical protein